MAGNPATFTVTVTNTGNVLLPADGTSVTITLPAGLNQRAGSPLTFNVGALAAGQTATFLVTVTTTAQGSQTVTATLTSPDITPNTVTATATVNVTPGLTAQERFVQALYLTDLGRAGSVAELDGWLATLNGPGGARAVVNAIEGSLEARMHTVQGWYSTFLGRQAQTSELTFWANMLAGQTLEQTLSLFLGAPGGEFFNRAQNLISTGTANQRYVQALYQLLLGRTASAAEIAGWVNALPALGLRGVALSILQGSEYRALVIGGYYSTLLHRPADPAGLNGWVGSNLSLTSIRIAIESSSEFFTNA
jgi:uncharacterized repeat protein (TIGR01451 family)